MSLKLLSSVYRCLGIGLFAGMMVVGSGCEVASFIDPSELKPGQNFSNRPLMVPILSKLDTRYEEPNDLFPNAVDIVPADLEVESSDYVIGKGDLLTVSITDLNGLGVETYKQSKVTESGNITLPLVRSIQAEGYTEAELVDVITKEYRDRNIANAAQVSVTVADARQRTFSMSGAISGTGEYAIPRSDFRLLDALIMGRDVNATGIDYIYVIRQTKAAKKPAGAGDQKPPTTGPGSDLAPRSRATSAHQPIFAADVAPRESGSTVIVDNKAMPVRSDKPKPANAADKNAPAAPAGTDYIEKVIRVPLTDLRNGQFKYNIVIRPRDMIYAPAPTVGEYYMSGHIARTGAYSLTARNLTLKQAVAAAGMLDGVAIPERCEIIRRIGKDQEIFARVDLAKIWEGQQPDIFLKSNDIVHVGTNILAPFIAAVRGGFRASYGFGFIYDRNLAYSTNSQNR